MALMTDLLSWQPTTSAPSWTFSGPPQLLLPSKLLGSTRTTCSTTQKKFPSLRDINTEYISKSTVYWHGCWETWATSLKYMNKLFGDSLSSIRIFFFPGFIFLPIIIWLLFDFSFFWGRRRAGCHVARLPWNSMYS